jgi:hypothetical protein
MGIEGSGTPTRMLKRMSFDGRIAWGMKPRGRFRSSRTHSGTRDAGVKGCDFILEPQVATGVGHPVNSRRFESH